MLDPNDSEWLRRFTQEDLLASGLRVALGALGPIGSVLGEFATQFVPRQRLDRLQDFVERLHERLSSLEDQFSARLQSSPAYSSLAEEVLLQAVRTPSDTRRLELVEFLRDGISLSDTELVDQQALLKILEALNDVQVLILIRHGSFPQSRRNQERAAFVEQHELVLEPDEPTYGIADEYVARRWEMYGHYVDDLIGRGLLQAPEGIAKSGRKKKVKITELGKLLLQAIGQTVDPHA
jgi:hypothetical protein